MDFDFISLPEELLRKILLLIPAKKIINLCRKNTTINQICKRESFWSEKFDATYPDYAGELINNSYLQTLAKLEEIRQIPIVDLYESKTYLEITAHSTFTDIISQLTRISNHFFTIHQINYPEEINVTTSPTNYNIIYYRLKNGLRKTISMDSQFYTILLGGNLNLFFSISEVHETLWLR